MGHAARRGQPIPIVLIVTAAVVLLAPIGLSAAGDEQCCPKTCPIVADSILKYANKTTYAYDFETKVTTTLSETSDESSVIGIRGTALLYANSSCQYYLTISNVKIAGTTKQITSGLGSFNGSTLQLNIQNGVIQSVCSASTDPAWSANIKRALASLLQISALGGNGVVNVMETDVSGYCPTTYNITGNTYVKTKALQSCTKRDGGTLVLQGIPYDVFSTDNTIPWVKSTQTCTQDINSQGIIASVNCVETHKLTTLSEGKGEAVSTVSTSIVYKSSQSSTSPPVTASHAKSPSSITYDHSQADVSGPTINAAYDSANGTLTELCHQTSTGAVTSLVPGLANNLRKSLKLIRNTYKLKALLETSANCSSTVSKIFKDALAKTGTTESIAYMATLIGQGKVDDITQKMYSIFTSFAYKPEVTALFEFSSLLATVEVDPALVLAGSALAHRYCAETNPNCGTNADYKKLINAIARIADESCMAQEEKAVNLGITALQALGNVDRLTLEAVAAVKKCMSASARMKMTSLQASRRDSCNAALKENAYTVFKTKNVSSEIRIHAFLAISRCFKLEDVDKMQEILDVEVSNQVGSFVASFISNIRVSQNPMKKSVKELFRKLSVPSKFPSDPRKFSTNFDYSTFSDFSNTGVSAEGNVIFSQNSFIPASFSIDVESQIFGRNYKFFEMEVFLQNFESLFEKYLGPVGKLRTKSRDDFTADARESLSNFKNEVLSRFRRDVPTSSVDKNEIEEKLAEVTRMDDDNGIGDFHLRVFDTTILSKSFSQESLRRDFRSNPLITLLDKLIAGAKNHSVDLTEPFTWLQNDFVIPTVSGLPLMFELEGTTVLSLQMSGKLDFANFYKTESPAEVSLRFVPSAATQLSAKMSVGAGPIEAGLQLQGSVHSASGFDLNMTRSEGKLEVKLDLPEDQVHIFSLRTQLVWTDTQNGVFNETTVASRYTFMENATLFCMNSSTSGLGACGEMYFPDYSARTAPPFPLGGNSMFACSIYKLDPDMKGYHLTIESTIKSDTEKAISIEFDTPGSAINRKVKASGHYIMGRSPKYELYVTSPSHYVSFEYQDWNEVFITGYEMKYTQDSSTYTAEAVVRIRNDSDNNIIYEPRVACDLPFVSAVFVSGEIVREPYKRVDFRLLGGETLGSDLRINLTGTMTRNQLDTLNKEYAFTNIEFQNKQMGNLILDGTADLKETKSAINLTAKYGNTGQKALKLDIELASPNPKSDKFVFFLSSTQNNFTFDVEYGRNETVNGVDRALLIERSCNDSELRFSGVSHYDYQSSQLFDIKNLIEFDYPKRNIDFALKADASSTPLEQLGDLQLRFGSTVSAVVKFLSNDNDSTTYDLEGHVKYRGRSLEFAEIATKLNPDTWKYLSSFNYTSPKKNPVTFSADTVLTLKMEDNYTLNDVFATIAFSGLDETIQLSSNVQTQNDSYHAHLVLNQTISGTLLNLASDYKRGIDGAASNFISRAFVSDYLDARLEERHTRGDDMFSYVKLDTIFLGTGFKVVTISDLVKTTDIVKYNASCQWNETDVNSTIKFGSISTFSDNQKFSLYDSRNTFVLMGNPQELYINRKTSADSYNGENFGIISYKNSAGKIYSVQTKNVNEYNDTLIGYTLGARVKLPGQKPYEFDLAQRAQNVNISNFVFDLTSDLSVTFNGTLALLLQAEAQSLQADGRTFSAHFNTSGAAVTDSLVVDLSSEILNGTIRSSGSAMCGHRRGGTFDFEVNYNTWSPKSTLDAKFALTSPYARLQSVDLTYKMGSICDSYQNFEYYTSGNVTVNNTVLTTWDNEISFLDTDFVARYNVYRGNEAVMLFSSTGDFQNKTVAVNGTVEVAGIESKMFFAANRNLRKVTLYYDLDTPYSGYENVWCKFIHKPRYVSGRGYTTKFQGSVYNETVTLISTIDSSNSTKALELSMTDKNGVRRVSFNLGGFDTSNYSVYTIASWGGNKAVSAAGSLLKSDTSVNGVLTLHSNAPRYEVDNWTVQVDKATPPNGISILSLQILSNQTEQGLITVTYKSENTTYTSGLNGSVAIRIGATADWGASFSFEDRNYTIGQDNEEGRGLGLTLQLTSEQYPVTLRLKGKETTEENFYETRFCSTNSHDDCRKIDLSYKNVRDLVDMEGVRFSTSYCSEGDEECRKFEVVRASVKVTGNGTTGNELTVLIKSVSEGKTLLDGFELKNFKTFNQVKDTVTVRELSVMLLSNNGENDADEHEQNTFGVKLFMNNDLPEPQSGVEIDLPERKLGLLYTLKDASVEEHLLEAMLDMLEKPDEKLVMSYVFDKVDNYTILVKHPALNKALRVSSRIKNEIGYLFNTETEFDIFKYGKQPLTFLFKIKNDTDAGSDLLIYAVDLGLGGLVSFNAHTDLRNGNGQYYTKTTLNYVDRFSAMRHYHFLFDCSDMGRTLEFEGPGNKRIFYSSQQSFLSQSSNFSDGYTVRKELLVPGMESSMVLEEKILKTFPASAYFKLTTGNSGSDGYEGWIGFKSDLEFQAGLYSNKGIEKTAMGDFTLALNNSRLLFVKSTWDDESVKTCLNKTITRLTDIKTELNLTSSEYSSKMFQEADFSRGVLKNALLDLTPVSDYYDEQREILKAEVLNSSVFNSYIRAHTDFFLNVFGSDIEEVKSAVGRFVSCTMNLVQEIFRGLGEVPSLIGDAAAQIPTVIDAVQTRLLKVVDFLITASNTVLDGIYKMIDRMPKFSPGSTYSYLSDTSSGIGKFLKGKLSDGLEQLTEAWSGLGSWGQYILDSSIVRNYIQYYTAKYERMAMTSISEYTKDLESLRDAILSTFPETECHEFFVSVPDYLQNNTRNNSMDDAVAQDAVYRKFVKCAEKTLSKVFTIDLSGGLIIARVPLPLPIKSLRKVNEAFEEAVASYSFTPPSYSYSIFDIYNQFSRPRGFSKILPPFRATSVLIGSHYQTFDNKFFHFEGNCQYILAADVSKDHNFTIVADYSESTDTMVKKSITLTNLKDEITIKSDKSIFINGQNTSLPASAGELKVNMHHGNWITAWGPAGFSVSFHTLYEVVIVKIDGYYRGKTNGFLGTPNYEIFDDLNSPSGQIVSTVPIMAEGWKLGECVEKPLPSYPVLPQEKCTEAFNGTSSLLAPCFSFVDPKEYRLTCESLAQEPGYDANRAVCTSAAAYRALCAIEGAPVENSEQCISN